MIRFTIYGEPATAGSKSAFTFKDKSGRVRASMAPASKKTKPWMQQVAGTARTEYQGPLLTGPIRYHMNFHFQRPASHFGTGKNAGIVKQSAPIYHIKRPDAIKLARAVEDALTGIIWKDDSQCCQTTSYKFYAISGSRVEIEIEELPESNDGK